MMTEHKNVYSSIYDEYMKKHGAEEAEGQLKHAMDNSSAAIAIAKQSSEMIQRMIGDTRRYKLLKQVDNKVKAAVEELREEFLNDLLMAKCQATPHHTILADHKYLETMFYQLSEKITNLQGTIQWVRLRLIPKEDDEWCVDNINDLLVELVRRMDQLERKVGISEKTQEDDEVSPSAATGF
jgi:hypothetical protein